jgi:hypothetical protein
MYEQSQHALITWNLRNSWRCVQYTTDKQEGLPVQYLVEISQEFFQTGSVLFEDVICLDFEKQ